MKIKSITFDCPVIYRGQIHYDLIREITAPELNYYINSNLFQCKKAFFIVINYYNNDYIIEVSSSKYSNVKKLTHRMTKLSMILNATVKLLFVKSGENGATVETVVSSDDPIIDSKE